jgi:hypothetical protein
MDIQRYLDNFFLTKDIVFVPGKKAIQNLFSNVDVLQSQKVHFFCDPFLRAPNVSNQGVINYVTSSTTFCLAVTSTLDLPYFNETNQDNANSKYTLKIEPLIVILNEIVKDLNCNGFTVSFDYTDATNVMDINFDGLIGNLKITI